MSLVTRAHGRFVFPRRVRRLAGHFARVLPPDASVLDVGAGDGLLDRLLLDLRPDLSLRAIDVLERPETHVPVERFDGVHLPCPDGSVDWAIFVDVLHHTDDPEALLRRAAGAARYGIVVKDHLAEGRVDDATLRLMDWVGNAGHGVRLPYHYWSRARWREVLARLGLEPTLWNERLGLYPFPARVVFERGLHFLARLEHRPPAGAPATATG